MDIEYCAGGFVSLCILRGAEGLIQHLNGPLWLCIFKLIAKFVVHGCPHYTTHSRAVIETLHLSVSGSMRSVGSRFFRCLIYKDV